jgi:abortive infection bacteriophage resistance protein
VGRENKHAGVRHYHANYEAPDMPPLWAMMEAITYGTLSRLFAGLQLSHRKAIAVRFGFDEVVLASWFRALNLLRNMCAHHNRLWNMPLHVDQPMAAKKLKAELGGAGDRYYARAVVMSALLEMIDPDSDWKARLVALLDRHPGIPTAAMGFPPDWRARPFWQAAASHSRAAPDAASATAAAGV